VQRLADFWLAEILLPGDTLVAAGVAYHLADLLLPELAACLADGGSGGAVPDDATLRLLLEPFCRALAGAFNPAMVYRLRWAPVGGRREGPVATAQVQQSLGPGPHIMLQAMITVLCSPRFCLLICGHPSLLPLPLPACRQGVFDPLVEEVRQAGEAALPGLNTAALAAHLFDLGAPHCLLRCLPGCLLLCCHKPLLACLPLHHARRQLSVGAPLDAPTAEVLLTAD
jgi:hypothetical protein